MATESLLDPMSLSPSDLDPVLLNENEEEIEYPESDDEPLAESSIQYRWITAIKTFIGWMYLNRKDVFVAADNFWYPVKGNPHEKLAPDIYAVFGAPHKKDRGCYKQWEENNIAIQVIFEIMSPYDYAPKMREKFAFYERHGSLEYYVYDPHRDTLEGYTRQNERFVPISNMDGWVSPLLGVRFEWRNSELRMFTPDGRVFIPPEDILEQFVYTAEQVELANEEIELANQEIDHLQNERDKARNERDKAQSERDKATELARNLAKELDRLRAQLAAASAPSPSSAASPKDSEPSS